MHARQRLLAQQKMTMIKTRELELQREMWEALLRISDQLQPRAELENELVTNKETSDDNVRWMLAVLELWGIGDVLIRCDPEASTKSLRRSVYNMRPGRTVPQQSPKDSHQSMGVVERANQTCAGIARTMRLKAQSKLK